jgi:Domain of unknown function DUF11
MVVNVTISNADTYVNPASNGSCRVIIPTSVADSNSTNNTCTNTVVVTAPAPDLVATKTNNVNGAPTIGVPFDWSVKVENVGDADAVFGRGQLVFRDVLPAGISFANVGVSGGGLGVTCGLFSGPEVRCVVNNGGLADFVAIAPGQSFTVVISVTINTAGTFDNGANPSVCETDSDGLVAESNENNNTCSNSVTLIGGSIKIIKDAQPDDTQKFLFDVHSSNPDTTNVADLDDDGDDSSGESSNATFNNLAPNTYEVFESGESDWIATVVCISRTGGSTFSYEQGVEGNGATATVTLEEGDDVVCTFTNTLDPKIIVVKVNPAGGASDSFVIDVSSSTQGTVATYNLSNTQMDMDYVPAGSYSVIERDPTNVGGGYLAPTYARGSIIGGAPVCGITITPVSVETVLQQSLDLLTQPFTVAAGDVVVVCVTNTPAAAPTWEKVAADPSYGQGSAQWVINVSNPTQGGINRTVKIVEDDTVTGLPAGCSLVTGGVECDLTPGDTKSFNVSRTIGQLCEESSADNSATAAVYNGSTPLFDLPDQGPITAIIPGDESVCGEPVILKVAGEFDAGDTFAFWTITIDNTDPIAVKRTVVITDGDSLIGEIPSNCGGTASPLSLECELDPGEVLQLKVQRAVTETCEGFTVTNSATATLDGNPIQGSPTDAIAVVVGANSRFCDSTVSVTKRYDTGSVDGEIDGSDAFVPSWGIALVCTGFGPADAVTAANGTVVFVVPGPGNGPDRDCTVTEATDILYVPLGGSLNGGALNGDTSVDFTLAGDDSVTVEFLNDPVIITLGTPPPGGPPPPAVETETETPTPEGPVPPTVVVVAPTATPEPTETPASAVSDATPIAPDTGSGLAPTSGNGFAAGLMMIAVALFVLSGAVGAFSMARSRK